MALALLTLSASVLAEYKVYEITETLSSVAGLYVETTEEKTYQQSSGTQKIFQAFQKIGGKDRDGITYYLLWPKSQSREWAIGYERKQGFVVAYRAKTVGPWFERSVPLTVAGEAYQEELEILK